MAVKKSELYSTLWEACNKLRGGVEPARYKDYVLLLLFHKYVSDKYKGEPFASIKITDATSFDALVKLKHTKTIGEEADKVMAAFLKDNGLDNELIGVSFNDTDSLGSGQELIDKVSGLIGVFENPALDFRNNKAAGDDIIGDAYEYFMMKFAQESGKSKGQFYTPGEVSRVIARLIGIDSIESNPNHPWTLYDPACGSGSLLIRAAYESPRNSEGRSIVSIYGQEKDKVTAGLAKMNITLHNEPSAEIRKGSTLSSPVFLSNNNTQLQTFDFVVMNPPFSDKSWSDGITGEDKYHRFDNYGTPPAKNGDYAWFLHVLKSLNSTGKAGIVMPHGVLFRGNAEEDIRRAILETRCIKGIISLPANLFYGTGIPACIIVIDKENAHSRTGIFFIDAGDGFTKDGSKNRLREQDIERIVRVFRSGTEIEGYSRLVPYTEILDGNGGNLNVLRYIHKSDGELPQNIEAHLTGNIPAEDIDSLSGLWTVSPGLKGQIFAGADSKQDMYTLAMDPDVISLAILVDENILAQRRKESSELFKAWREEARTLLMSIDSSTDPKALIRELGDRLLMKYSDSVFVDKYNVFDCLMNYWNAKMQDDVYLLRSESWLAGRAVETETVKGKVKSWEGALIPREVVEREYFGARRAAIAALAKEVAALDAQIEEIRGQYEKDEDMTDDDVMAVNDKAAQKKSAEREMRTLRKELDGLVLKKYEELTEEEIMRLVFDVKWMGYIADGVRGEFEREFGRYASGVVELARRYERPLGEIMSEVDASRAGVESALGRMGYTW